MTNKNIKPSKVKVLITDREIKTYVHPTRIAILRMLAAKKRTVSSIAKELNVHPANITHRGYTANRQLQPRSYMVKS